MKLRCTVAYCPQWTMIYKTTHKKVRLNTGSVAECPTELRLWVPSSKLEEIKQETKSVTHKPAIRTQGSQQKEDRSH